jgi:hypothetical protein
MITSDSYSEQGALKIDKMIHVPPSAAEGAAIATRKYRVCSAHK